MLKRPTISDVARLADVSKSTVSHVVNNTRYVEEETRLRVLTAIDKLAYRPSSAARSLTTKRTGTAGMIISDASNIFFGEMLRGVEDVLLPLSYSLTVCSTDEVLEREPRYLDLLLQQRVDGIIAAATSQNWSAILEAEALHMPIVFVDRKFAELAGPYVGVDNEGGAHLGMQYLIQQGYTEIGVLAGFQRLSTIRERLHGCQRAFEEAGLPIHDEWLITSHLSIEAGKTSMLRLLSCTPRPKAVFVGNNLLLLGALLAIKESGLRCPDEIAIVGFDDHPWAAVANPPVTVVRQPARQLGRCAAEMLYTLIDGKQPAEQHLILGCELVVRQSA